MTFVSKCLVLLLACGLSVAYASPYSRLREHIRGGNREHRVYGQNCGSDELTCVLPKDCKYQCPPRFTEGVNDGACYFISNSTLNENRTFADAQDFCSNIADDLLWLEDPKELLNILDTYKDVDLNVTLNAIYSRDHKAWIWSGTHEKIEWKRLFRDLHRFQVIEDIVESARIGDCFALDLMNRQLVVVECNSPSGYVCKLGEAEGSCGKTGQTTCCYTPTFNFYIKNKDIAHDAGLQLGPSGCTFQIGGQSRKCEEVLNSVEEESNGTLSRVGSSYFYLSSSEDPCLGREAIITSEAVHQYAIRILSTEEITHNESTVRIGLTYNLRERKGHWSNGKADDYYPTYWLSGEPRRSQALDGGCAAYSKTPGLSDFRWRLFPMADCEGNLKFCELPVFRSPSVKRARPETCGIRKERGILAKAFYSTYDTTEASFGEFPWHAAISFYENRGSGARKIYACSGALIHEKFVLTSAHCVSSIRHSNIQVTLGDHDLKDSGAILEPMDFLVEEIIIHPGYGEYHTYHDDLALLQLRNKVNVTEYPHIGLGCLPDPKLIKSHNGRWDCFSVGWPDKGYGYRKVLERVDVEFTSEGFCHRLNQDYYRKLRYAQSSPQSNRYGNPESTGNLFRHDEPDLLCTTPKSDGQCSGDDTSILICKKETIYVDKPFFAPPGHSSYKSAKGHIISSSQQSSHSHRPLPARREVEYIVNSYGEDRFDSDKYYVVGIGNGLSECGKGGRSGGSYQNSHGQQPSRFSSRFAEVWSSVYDYLPFIHRSVDSYTN